MTSQTGRTRAALFTAFAGLGVTASFFPAILPAVERVVGGDLSAAIPVLFAGLLVGVLATGPLLAHVSSGAAIVLGSLSQALGILVAAVAPIDVLFIAAAALAGFGFGVVEASASIAAKASVSGSATGLLSALTGTVAVCAAVTPLVIAVGAASVPALGALALLPVVTVVLLGRSAGAASRTAGAAASSAGTAARSAGGPRASGRMLLPVLPFALALPLYVGVETVLSGWSAVIPERALALDPAAAAVGTSVFWTLMALGRFGAAGLRRRGVRAGAILAGGSGAAAVLLGCAGALIDAAPVWALAAVAASVIALAPSYGLILGLALDRLDAAESPAVTGALVACGSIGGTFIPTAILLIGRDPASGVTFAASAVLCLLVPGLVWFARRGARSAPVEQGRVG